MLKSLNLLRVAQNYKVPLVPTRKFSNFLGIMEKAIEKQVEQNKEKNEERFKRHREQRYNGKVKRRDWVEETEEAKRIRLETNPIERVKKKKAVLMLGYSGASYNGMQRNPDVKTIEGELLQTMLKHGWINEEGFATPQQAFFQRAARTDKGVSAARQIVSMKLPETIDIEALNKDLPEDIKVFAYRRVTKGFNSKTTCDARSYSYTLPTYIFTKDGEEINKTSFRLPPERLEELNKLLSIYLGTKNFHNFTIRKDANDRSANRHIKSFICQKPFIPDNTEVEFARLKITGQSFMMHQIRKMVSLVIAVMRGFEDESIITRAFQKEPLNIMKAPGLGLVLDNVHYDRYNERYGQTHEKLLFEEQDEVVEEFFRKYIMSTIIETELRETPTLDWVGRLKNHSCSVTEKDDRSDKEGYDSD